MLTDTFRGDNDALIRSIEALVDLSDKGALIPHGIGGHAKALLCSAASRIKAGAASRDAEIARLKSVPMKYRRMAFNAQLQNENAQLRAQIKMLQEALEKACARIEEHGFEIGEHWKIGREALNATKEQP